MNINSELEKLRYNLSGIRKTIISIADKVLLYLGLLNVLLLVYKFGFEKPELIDETLIFYFEIILIVFFPILLIRMLLELIRHINKKKIFSEYILIVFVFLILAVRTFFPEWLVGNWEWAMFLSRNIFLYLSILTVAIVEISRQSLDFFTLKLNPARLFIYSFLLIIMLGTGLLLLPRATTHGISVLDALFTSTSAVCVTGLVVLDTASDFTFFGKIIIFVLFQVGGLGVMTFTSFFGFLFHGGFSFQNELFLQNFINEENMGEIFNTILKVLTITIGIELGAAMFIYFSIDSNVFASTSEHIFFSIFHAVSAFCNAGFSTLSDGLFDNRFRFNYYFQLIIAFTIILGGLGFPIVFNFYKYLKHYFKNKYRQIIYRESYKHSPRIINVNTKIVVATTTILLVLGAILFFITEYNNTLEVHPWNGKIVTAFFGSVTPRTAGFNTINMAALLPSTVLIYFFLMWIGASPASTGGGIKTSAFAVAILNTFSIAKGKDRLEIFRREIGDESIKRSLAIIILSIFIIGCAILMVTIFDKEKALLSVAFECISAYSTVGLSLGITPDLSELSKIVIIITMFLGRVGTLTVIIGFLTKATSLRYRYPSENVFIN